jgi:hypothetical protein
MNEEEYNYLKNNPTKATMIDKFGYIHLYNTNYELHKIASSQFIYKIIDELKDKDEKISKAIEIIRNDTTLNPQRQRDRLTNILESNKED